jgi:ribonuclease Z
MIVKIVGNGGALNDGLPFNSFLIDNSFLAETPPDITASLFREHYDFSQLKTIFISHFHADHYFGFPFLVLRLFFNRIKNRIQVLGPVGIQSRIQEICRISFGKEHPINAWVQNQIDFSEIRADETITLENGQMMKIIPMSHFIETYGFSLYEKDRHAFTYFADTVWTDSLIASIVSKPKAILADMNGEPDDPVQLHLSEKDILEKALPISGKETVFYGTHLKSQKTRRHKRIRYVHPGDVIEL